VNEGTVPLRRELAAVVQTARDYGVNVAAHAHGEESMPRAVRAHGDNGMEFVYMV
jgi:imidazolonepropionase-like amidohydrolase